MYLFDTDHLVIAQQQTAPEYGRLIRRERQHDPASFFVSIISFHEQVMGWHTYIPRAKDAAGVVRGYARLNQLLTDFTKAQVLEFDDNASAIFEKLRKQRVRIGTMDLRIAAIALSHDLTVLTRNIVDFGQIPGLIVEDWTLP